MNSNVKINKRIFNVYIISLAILTLPQLSSTISEVKFHDRVRNGFLWFHYFNNNQTYNINKRRA